jgi:hypothetical protein
MNFRVDPLAVVNTLHSMIEQNNSRMTAVKAVHELAAKGIVLPGKTDKEQAQVLASLISLCSSSFLDVRTGKGGGIGLPTTRAAATSKRKSPSKASQASDQAEGEASPDDFLATGT